MPSEKYCCPDDEHPCQVDQAERIRNGLWKPSREQGFHDIGMKFSAAHHASFKTQESMGIGSQVNILVSDMLRSDDDHFVFEALNVLIRSARGLRRRLKERRGIVPGGPTKPMGRYESYSVPPATQ